MCKMLEFLMLSLCSGFSDTAISTHKKVEISRAETMCTFSQVFFAFLSKGSVTDGLADKPF